MIRQGITNRMSDSETISTKPVPALFRSIWEICWRGSNTDLAVSCRCQSKLWLQEAFGEWSTCSSCICFIRTTTSPLERWRAPPLAIGANIYKLRVDQMPTGKVHLTVVLCNLVASGEIWIEIMLSVKRWTWLNIGVKSQCGSQSQIYAFGVEMLDVLRSVYV